MELYSLHPMPDTGTASFLELIRGQPADDDRPDLVTGQLWYRRLHGNQSPRPNDLTFGFAAWLTTQYPVFARQALSLSSWEARVDRGSGMLLRPPSRMFIDAGLDPAIARQMPIRIEGGDGMMGGAHIPARLMGDYLDRLERYSERSVRRLNEAELDGPELVALMIEAVQTTHAHGLGLYEAVEVVDGGDPNTWPPGSRVISHASDRSMVERLHEAARPPKEPGLIARLLRRR